MAGFDRPRLELGAKLGVLLPTIQSPRENHPMNIIPKSVGSILILGALAGCAGDDGDAARVEHAAQRRASPDQDRRRSTGRQDRE